MSASSAFDPVLLFQLYSTPDTTSNMVYEFARNVITKDEGVTIEAVVDLGAGTGSLLYPWINCATVDYFLAVEGTKDKQVEYALRKTLKKMKDIRSDVKILLWLENFFDHLELGLPEGVVSVFVMNPTFAYFKESVLSAAQFLKNGDYLVLIHPENHLLMGSLNSRDVELMDSTGLRMIQQISLGNVGYNHGPPKRTKDYATVFKKDPENAVMTVDIAKPTPEVIERVQDDVIRLQHGVALERLQQCKNWLWVFRLYGTLKHYVRIEGAADGSRMRMPAEQITRIVQQLYLEKYQCLKSSDLPLLRQFFRLFEIETKDPEYAARILANSVNGLKLLKSLPDYQTVKKVCTFAERVTREIHELDFTPHLNPIPTSSEQFFARILCDLLQKHRIVQVSANNLARVLSVTTRDFPQEYQQRLKKTRGSARESAPAEPSAEAAQSSRAKRRAEALEMGSAIEAAGEMDKEAAMDVDQGELVVLGEEGILRTKAAIRAGMDRVAAEEDESLLTFIGLEPEAWDEQKEAIQQLVSSMNAEEAREEQLARALTEPTAGEQEQRRKRREEIRSVWASTPSASIPAAAQTPTPITIQFRASASGLPERSGKEEALVQESPERTPARTPSPSPPARVTHVTPLRVTRSMSRAISSKDRTALSPTFSVSSELMSPLSPQDTPATPPQPSQPDYTPATPPQPNQPDFVIQNFTPRGKRVDPTGCEACRNATDESSENRCDLCGNVVCFDHARCESCRVFGDCTYEDIDVDEKAAPISKYEAKDIVQSALEKAKRKAAPRETKSEYCGACRNWVAKTERCWMCSVCYELYHATDVCIAKLFAEPTMVAEEGETADPSLVPTVDYAREYALWRYCGKCGKGKTQGITCRNCHRLLCLDCLEHALVNFKPKE